MTGSAADGPAFLSNDISIDRFSSNGKLINLHVSALKADIQFRTDNVAPFLRSRLWLRGFKALRPTSAVNSLGTIFVHGEVKNVTPDSASGAITIDAKEGASEHEWIRKSDAFLTFMHRGLAFSRGMHLQSPRLDCLVGDRLTHTFFAGGASALGLAPVHFLLQEEFIKTLAVRFDDSEAIPEIFWTAIGWLNSNSHFDEARFLASMTCLETIVECVRPSPISTAMPKPDYQPIKEHLLTALRQLDLSPELNNIFASRISQLNTRSLGQKIADLRDHFCLPAEDYPDEQIKALIGMRNDIVHRGTPKTAEDLWPMVILVREFVTQIAFRVLKYSGPYERYLGGHQTVHLQR
ncbi:hypothetical protein EGU54_12615 [Achromobacter aegrifaciens]|nr:hypothetical protein EGU54_12615 [Achromobacter aegrifaciens]